jgi:hypothetical protein
MGSIAVNAIELMFIVLIIAVIGISTISTLYVNKNLISASFWDLAGLSIIMLFIATTFLFAYYKIRR